LRREGIATKRARKERSRREIASRSHRSGAVVSEVTFSVQALAEGDAAATLTAYDGTTFAPLPLPVHRAARITLTEQTADARMPVTSITTPNTWGPRIRALAFDADGRQLEARYGTTVTSSDWNVVRLNEPGTGNVYSTSIESFDVQIAYAGSGSATITFSAASATTVLPVTVE
jgi:hypothetical protein